MTPLDWWRRDTYATAVRLPDPEPIDRPSPVYPVIDRTEPTCPPQGVHEAPAPEWVRGSAVGMCRFPGQPTRYDESADEIGGTKHYDDYLES
jgi:hypothetical protein